MIDSITTIKSDSSRRTLGKGSGNTITKIFLTIC
jgi:hypothetical protein